jgi:hypothetical protein
MNIEGQIVAWLKAWVDCVVGMVLSGTTAIRRTHRWDEVALTVARLATTSSKDGVAEGFLEPADTKSADIRNRVAPTLVKRKTWTKRDSYAASMALLPAAERTIKAPHGFRKSMHGIVLHVIAEDMSNMYCGMTATLMGVSSFPSATLRGSMVVVATTKTMPLSAESRRSMTTRARSAACMVEHLEVSSSL